MAEAAKEAIQVGQESLEQSKPIYSLRCRFCRTALLQSDKITTSHETSSDRCGNCLFLDEDDDLPSWIQNAIESSGWTKGRIYCPKQDCNARVGGFDFVQGLLCSCGIFTIPAIWIQDGKVDVNVINSRTSANKPFLVCDGNTSTNGLQRSLQREKPDFMVLETPDSLSVDEQLGVQHVGPTESSTQEETVDESASSESPLNQIGVLTVNVRPLSVSTGILAVGAQTTIEGQIVLTRARTQEHLEMCDNALKCAATRTKISKHDRLTVVSQRPKKGKCVSLGNRFENLNVEEPQVLSAPRVEAIEDHFICAVCLDCFYKPYKCPCTHVFCEPCLRQLYHARNGSLNCPVCRSPVRYIEPADELRKQLQKSHFKTVKARETFEKTAKYKKWPLPPIGPLPFLRKHRPLVPSQDKRLIKLAGILLFIVCCVILHTAVLIMNLHH